MAKIVAQTKENGMNTHVIRRLLMSVIAMSLSQLVMADEFSVDTGKRPITVGIGILYKDKPYKKYDSSEKTTCCKSLRRKNAIAGEISMPGRGGITERISPSTGSVIFHTNCVTGLE